MKNIFLGMMVLLVSITAQAQAKKNKNAKYEFEVNGTCEMCKKRIEKAAFSVSGVKSAEWNIGDHSLKLLVNENKCSLDDIKKAVAEVGHDTDEVKATDEQYNKLHGCCRYERK